MKSDLKKNKEAITNRFKNMTASQKLNLSLSLYNSARELRKSAIKQLHQELTNAEIENKIKEIFFYART
jgi:precorrin-3B methylase